MGYFTETMVLIESKKEARYYLSTSKGGDPIKEYRNPKYLLRMYAASKGIRDGEGCLFIDNSTSKLLDDVLYMYKDNGFIKVLVASGPFSKLLNKYNIPVKELDKGGRKDREEVFKKALSLLKSSIPSKIKSSGEFYSSSSNLSGDDKESHDDFVDGVSNYVTIFYASLWDIDKNARTNAGSDEHISTIWNPLDNCLSEINKKLPNGYKLAYDGGDWDDIDISLQYSK